MELLGVLKGAVDAALALGRAAREREAREIASPRVDEIATSFTPGAEFVTSIVGIDRKHAEDWRVVSVRVVDNGPMVAIRTGDVVSDGYGNDVRNPGAWSTYCDLKGYGLPSGILTTPTDRDVTLIFSLAPKSAPLRLRDSAPYVVKAQTPPAGVHPT